MRTKHKLMTYFLSFALLLGMISTVNVSAAKKISLSNKKITITKGSSKTIKVKNTKKKVTWKILSGKKCITLKKKGKTSAKVKGKKKGKAKVQALVEKKNLVCTVTVDDKVISKQQNNSQALDNDKPIQPLNTVIPTESPYQKGIITLHYNDDNANEVREQILNSKNPVHVIVDEGVTGIWESEFQDCTSLISIEIPESVTSIGFAAFFGCSNLTSIEIPKSVTSIGTWAFSKCNSLISIKVAENNQSYDSRDNCNAIIETETNTLIMGCKNTKIPGNITSIGSWAFLGYSSLTSIAIPENVTVIGDSAFSECSSLTSIEIPKSVTSIGTGVFSECSSLTSIKVAENNQSYDSRNNCNAIIETETNTLIIGCKNTKIPESVTSIGNSAFYLCDSLTSIDIPESVTNIGFAAFLSCSNLTNIEIPGNVTSIGDFAFSSCSSLTNIKIPGSVTVIGNFAFSSCDRLTNIEIPGSVTSIGEDIFSYCDRLTNIIWQDTTYGSADEFMKAFQCV